jgi:hypothetical protein
MKVHHGVTTGDGVGAAHSVATGDGVGAAYMEPAYTGRRRLPHQEGEAHGHLELEDRHHGWPPHSCGGSLPLGGG